jgi:hypothetical protein
MPGPFENRMDNPAIRRRRALAEATSKRESGNRSIVKRDLAAIRKNAGYNPRVTAFKKYGGELNTNDPITPIAVSAVANMLPDPIMLRQAAQDPIGTLKGAAEIASLASPLANAYRGYKLVTGQGASVTGADMQDIEQAVEVAGLIPQGKGVKAAGKLGNAFLRSKVGLEFYQPMKEAGQAGIRSLNMGINPDIGLRRAGVDLNKELDKAQSWLNDWEWSPGSATEFDTVTAAVDKINWGPYQRPVSKRVAGPTDITKINLEDMSSTERSYFSEEELQVFDNLDYLKSIDRQTDAAFRGSAEPVRVRVQKYPTWEQFRDRLTGERLGGIPTNKKRELYDETLKLIDDTGGYWSVKKLEIGKKPVSVGGMDMAHLQHFATLGGRGVTSKGTINVEAQQAALNRAQQTQGVGGHSGFKDWWEANQKSASNRAIIEALYFDRF